MVALNPQEIYLHACIPYTMILQLQEESFPGLASRANRSDSFIAPHPSPLTPHPSSPPLNPHPCSSCPAIFLQGLELQRAAVEVSKSPRDPEHVACKPRRAGWGEGGGCPPVDLAHRRRGGTIYFFKLIFIGKWVQHSRSSTRSH